jgi:hypothetical protein
MELELEGRRHIIRPGSHLCHFYSTVEELISIAAVVIARGLEDGYRCLWIGDKKRELLFRGALELRQPGLYRRGTGVETFDERRLVDLGQAEDTWTQQHISAGALLCIADRSALSVEGKFDPYKIISFQLTEIDRAVRDGFAGLVVVQDMTWLADSGATNQQLLKHEAAADAVFAYQNRPLIALTQYDRQKTDAGLVAELLKLHRLSILGRYARLNPQHVDPDRYVSHIIKATRLEKGPRNRPGPFGRSNSAHNGANTSLQSQAPRPRTPLGLDDVPLAPPNPGRQERRVLWLKQTPAFTRQQPER